MAEPSPQLDDGQIYDQPGNARSSPPPDLKALEGGGETTLPKSGNLSDASDGKTSLEKLSAAEQSASADSKHPQQVGSGYKPGSLPQSIRARLTAGRNRKFLIGGGVALFIAGVSIVIFLALLPLKILHIVDNIQSHFFATAQNAVTNEVDNMMSSYLKKYVLPGLKHCGNGGAYSSTIDKGCTPISITGSSPVANLYNSWKTARVENTLAEKYGTEFRYNSKSGRYYIKSPYLSKDIDISDFAEGNAATLSDSIGWQEVSGKEFSTFLSNFHNNLDDLTKFSRVMYRFKMNGLLTKYGGWSRCIVSCDARRTFTDSLQNKKRAVKIKIAQRVISPMSEQLSLIFQCVITSCDIQPDIKQAGLNGEPRSPAEVQLQEALTQLAAEEGSETTLDAVAQAEKDINEKGWTRYAMGELFAKAAGRFGGDEVAARELGQNVLGPVGWALLASQLISGLNSAGPILTELGYEMNSTAYANTFLTYRTYADEIKSGNVDSTMVGSFVNSLGAGSQCYDGSNLDSNGNCSNGEKQLGGTAEAEQTPLYQKLINNSDSPGSSKYICKDGKPVPAGQLTCNEEKINQGNAQANELHRVLSDTPVLNAVTQLANIINGTIGRLIAKFVSPITQVLSFLIQNTPGVSQAWNSLVSFSSNLLSPLFKDLVSNLVNVPMSTNMSGARTFDSAAGGADVLGNDFSHHQLGGTELTNQQVNNIITAQASQDLQTYKNESFFAKISDTNSNYSPINKLAMSMPLSWTDFQSSLASLFVNPLKSLTHSIGSVFSPGHVLAVTTLQSDPFGVTQYGYPPDDPVFKTDSETYWQQHCTDSSYTDAWNSYSLSNINPDTWQTENPQQSIPNLIGSDPKGTDPCLLIQTAIGSAGAIYNSNLLTQSDLSSP